MSTSTTISSENAETGNDLGSNNETPSIDDSSGGGVGGFSLGLSKRQVAVMLGVAVVVGLLLWRLRDQSGSGGSEAAEEVEKARTEDIAGELELKDTDGDGETEIVVPNNPDDELQKDEAILEHLKATGKMGGGD